MNADGPYQATDPAELRRQIMSSNVPKNEREHWAARQIEKLEDEIEELKDKRSALRTTLVNCFRYLGNAIQRMTLNESASTGTQEISAEVAKTLDADMSGDPNVPLAREEMDRQLVVLALAKLTFTHPGFSYACREAAKKFYAEKMFDEFVSHGPDIVAKIE